MLMCAMVALSFFDTEHLSMVPIDQMSQQWWRVFTGHLAHSNTVHLLMNLVGFIIICATFWRETLWRESAVIFFLLMLGTSICLSLLSENSYVGFSSVLHGYLAYLLLRHWRSQPWLHGIFLMVIGAKVLSEQLGLIDTSSTAELIGVPVAVNAHLYGTLCGLGLAATSSVLNSRVLPKSE